MPRHTVGVDVIVMHGASPSGYGAVVDIVEAANRLSASRHRPVDLRVLSADGGLMPMRSGLHVETVGVDGRSARDAVVAVGIGSVTPDELDARLVERDIGVLAEWLHDATRRGAIIAGACTGTFLLGEAGALDGHRCTTTWWLSHYLSRRYPGADVQADQMLVVDGSIWTGGAVFSHIDLTMELIRYHLGTGLAREVANRMAVDRRNDQARYRLSSIERTGSPEVDLIESMVLSDLLAPITLEQLAEAAGTSARTLHRRVQAATGHAPMELVRRARLRAAIELLRTTDASVADVAARVGLSDSAALYRLTNRVVGKNPSQLRDRLPTP
jgi:transcriptional regulator GlxA family with amidase domain